MSEDSQATMSDGFPLVAGDLAIEVSGLCKRFGGVLANDAVGLEVERGAIHGIVGENGAGKSTLVSILYGFYRADSGVIRVDGVDADICGTSDAIRLGIGMVHQHFMLVPSFTVLENIILGHERGRGRRLSDALSSAREVLSALAADYGLEVPLDSVVSELSVGLQQRVEILKALYRGARVLILDEPTGVLTPQETEQLFAILKSLSSEGVTVLFITHKLREIMAVTDSVSVMRGGRMVAHLRTEATSAEALAELMVGRKVLIAADFPAARKGAVLLEASDVRLESASGVPLLRGIDFEVRGGEILGIAGVSGNGQSELLEVLSGIVPPSGGVIRVCGESLSSKSSSKISPKISPRVLKSLGVAHVPEDRHAMGMVLAFSAAESSVLGYEGQAALGDGVWFSPVRLSEHCLGLMSAYDIRPPEPGLRCDLFSGGNQQKLVLAREMSASPKVLLVGQPTRGVDIGAIEFIYSRLIAMRDRGCAIVLVSVELDEIFTLSDRIMVMNSGRMMGIVDKADADLQSVGLMMAGVEQYVQ